MKRGKWLAELALGSSGKPSLKNKKTYVKQKVEKTLPDYVDMFDRGKWEELQDYLKYNSSSRGSDVCSTMFNKSESARILKGTVNEGVEKKKVGVIQEGSDNSFECDIGEAMSVVEGQVLEEMESMKITSRPRPSGSLNYNSSSCGSDVCSRMFNMSDSARILKGTVNEGVEKKKVGVIQEGSDNSFECDIGEAMSIVEGQVLEEMESMTIINRPTGNLPNQSFVWENEMDSVKLSSDVGTESFVLGEANMKENVGSSSIFSISSTGELILEEEENITRQQLFSTEESLSLDKGIAQVNLDGSISGFEHMSDEGIGKVNLEGSISEFEHMYDEEFSTNVNISDSSNKSKKYIRRWDRKNFCLYCRNLVTNFSRHIIKFHRMEKEVIEYTSVLDSDLKLRKRKRQAITDDLRKRGNFLYNSSSSNHNEILPTRRPSKNVKQPKILFDYLTCQYCLGMFSRKTFYQHRNKCTSLETPEEMEESINIGEIVFGSKERKGTKSDGIQIIPNVGGASKLLVDRIFPILNKDEFGLIAINDPLILSIGSHFLFSHQEKKDEYSITKKLRDSAKLLKLCRKDPDIIHFEDIFKPCKFEVVISCVQQLCGLDSESGAVKVVGMPARLAYVIQEGAKLLSCEVITNNNISPHMKEKIKKDISEFILLYKNKWKFLISSNAEKTRKKMRSMKPSILPDDDDIRTISAKIKELEIEYYKEVSKQVTPQNYEDLCKITIAHIITFNRRRSGEAARAELQYYLNRPAQEDLTEDVLATLTGEEKEALPRLTVFMIPGKLLHSVPILLTASMKANIDLIISSRAALGIPRENHLLFARATTLNPFDGSKILRDLRETLNLKKKSFMTATGLRHHLATKSQVNGSEQLTENVCQFLGHTKGVHKQNYRIPLQAIQRGQIGSRLLRMEEGSNKRNCETNHQCSTDVNQTFKETCNQSDDSQDEDFIPSDSEVHSRKKVKRKIIARRRWSDEEKQCVLGALGKYISDNKNPGMKVCTELVRSNPILAGRTWQQVNTLINNYKTGKAKLPTSFQPLLS